MGGHMFESGFPGGWGVWFELAELSRLGMASFFSFDGCIVAVSRPKMIPLGGITNADNPF